MRKGHRRPKIMQTKRVGVYSRLMNPKDKNKVIGSGKPNEVSKKPMGVWT